MIWRWIAAGLSVALGVMAIILWRNEGAHAGDAFERSRPELEASGAHDERVDVPREAPRANAATREERRFNRYDKNRDDLIDRDEYLASRRKAFAKLDINGDGQLSFDEWAARTIDKFGKADADRSGHLSRVEFATTAVQRKTKAISKCKCPATTDGTTDTD